MSSSRWLSLISCFALFGCSTLQPLSTNPEQLSQTLKSGDRVELRTLEGQQLDLTLQSVDTAGLHGGGRDIPFGNIQSISRKETSGTRTALLVLGVVAVGAAAAGGGGGGGGMGGGGY